MLVDAPALTLLGDRVILSAVPLHPPPAEAGGEADRLEAASTNSFSPSEEGTESPVNEQLWYFLFRETDGAAGGVGTSVSASG